MGTVSFRSALILYFYLQARDGRTPYEPFAPFFYALSRAYFTKGIFSTIRKIFSSHLLSSTNKSDYNASTVRRVLQYFAGSTGVLSSSPESTPVLCGKYWSTFLIGLQYFPDSTGIRTGVIQHSERNRDHTLQTLAHRGTGASMARRRIRLPG